MLERAKACLQSGARETLRSRSQTSRSRRALHCDFWTHGANTPDLPPWLAPSALPVNPTVEEHETRRWHAIDQDERTASIGSSSYEAPYLDFLYPPQALSLLHRTGRAGQQWERWERRNARRLPDGFVQASRGYASRSHGRAFPAQQRGPGEDALTSVETSFEDTRGRAGSNEKRQRAKELVERRRDGAPKRPSNDEMVNNDTAAAIAGSEKLDVPGTGPLDRDTALVREHQSFTIRPNDRSGTLQDGQNLINYAPVSAGTFSEQGATDSEPTYGPRSSPDVPDLVEVSVEEENTDASPYVRLQRLQRVMASARIMPSGDQRVYQYQTERLVNHVLGMYQDLPHELQVDTRLKLALIEWLAPFDYNVAEHKCISLYKSVVQKDMSLAAYLATLTVLMRQRSFPALVTLYEEAVQWLPNSQQLTRKFFEYMVVEQRWDFALRIAKRLQGTAEHEYMGAGEAMIWVDLSNIPALLEKAFNLMKYVEQTRELPDQDPGLDLFCARFCKEALAQELDAKGSSGLPPSFNATSLQQKYARKELRQVITQLQHLPGEDTAKTYHSLLVALLREDARFPFRSMYWLASYLYEMIRKEDSFRIPRQTFASMLNRLTAYLITSDKQGGSLTSLSISKLTSDWIEDYGKLEWNNLKRVMAFFALAGKPDEVDYWMNYARSIYNDYTVLGEVLWTTIRAHAQKLDLPATQTAFREAQAIATKHGQSLDIRCWNSLLSAHSRVGDIDGCLKILQNMIDQGVKADTASFLPALLVLGKRGDIGAVRSLMSQYEYLSKEKSPTQFYASLISAHVKSGEIKEAEDVLYDVFEGVSHGDFQRSMTWPCNTVLMAHAARGDIDSTMRVYGWMKSRDIRKDERTFAALMQALARHAQTHAAWKLLRVVLPEQKLLPTAMHYAIIMRGYLNQGMVEEALMVHDHMTTQNIKATYATNAVYLQARADFEDKITSPPRNAPPRGTLRKRLQKRDMSDSDSVSNPDGALVESIEDLKKILRKSDRTETVGYVPGMATSLDTSSSSLFGTLIYVHGKRGCFRAVHELYAQYQKHRKDNARELRDPIVIVEALMDALLSAGDYEEVERYWSLAKEQVDEIAPPMNVTVPDLVKRKQLREKSLADGGSDGISKASVDATTLPEHADPAADVAALGFDPSNVATSAAETIRPPTSFAIAPDSNAKARPAPGKAHIISGPLRLYLGALAGQNRVMDIVSTVSAALNQGYQLDIRTWNTFIEKLCLASPPLTLLAYVLTERYLIPQFPGWADISPLSTPRHTARSQGLQYIRARFLPPGLLMPQYSTLVYLGAALLKLRHMENTGELAAQDLGSSERYIGSLKQIRSLAPRTLYAVQSMPAVAGDPLQARLLRRED